VTYAHSIPRAALEAALDGVPTSEKAAVESALWRAMRVLTESGQLLSGGARTEYGVRTYGGHIQPTVSMHVADRRVLALRNEGQKNVYRVSRLVSDWQRDEPA
jgi:hypothetical protein